ncbi:peptidoglycan bridge formation protein FemAB [Carbonactinospora thermoautotrophica]|uniref:lipid II:glycine glycyltransferase FemX n=1 Tax=Carbonactinospora thermoautotrophica TaxID=1469144 RepID=UPI00226F5C6C|nr:peptidoglycan bridge formation glycyltransferase FemA/FemB family protein [Carbonactinospora thermoautotrophica]MCX9191232.1 peptidoglycan bridge formation protein FemAB [Carbonactinospora thermoautotrophica]
MPLTLSAGSTADQPAHPHNPPQRLRTLSRQEHLDFIQRLPSASFLQCPSWGDVKVGWTAESLGWEDSEGNLVGSALVLYRQAPKVKRYFAYIPEGPVINWADGDLSRWLDPLLAHLREKGVFTVKMGPPLAVRRWEAETLKRAIAAGRAKTLREVPADHINDIALRVAEQLRAAGWLHASEGESGTGDVQPRYVFQLPLAGRSLEDVWKGFNQQWRRNIKKAEKCGVEVVEGGYDDLPIFFELLEITQQRDGFNLGRTLKYYQRQYEALRAEDPERMKLYLAKHGGEVLAAATMLKVGNHIWFQSGGSANHKREVRPSNGLQWRMIQDAHAQGAAVYDMRGVGETLDPEVRKFGLLQFKLGTGGQTVEYLGEWDFPLNKLLHKAFDFYMSHR